MKLPFFKSIFRNLNLSKSLAWSQLSHKKVRLSVAITGISFSNILMFTQLGFLAVLTKGTTQLHESLTGDLVLVSAFNRTLQRRGGFPKDYLYQAEAISGVDTVLPVYLSWGRWVNPNALNQANTEDRPPPYHIVRIIAFNPTLPPILNIPDVQKHSDKLTVPNTVLFDTLSESSIGEIPDLITQEANLLTMMNNHRTEIVGTFVMGRTFYESGTIIMSDETYSRYDQRHSLDQVSVGIVHLEKGVNPDAILPRLRESLPKDIAILTHEQLITREEQFQESQPSGIVLKFGTVVGFVVGLIILYQILYADVSDHLPEYATLKAMGYTDTYLLLVVLQEAIILGFFGFIPGFLASLWIYQLLADLTKMYLIMRSGIALQVFILTITMCCISGILASGKLRSADPVEIF